MGEHDLARYCPACGRTIARDDITFCIFCNAEFAAGEADRVGRSMSKSVAAAGPMFTGRTVGGLLLALGGVLLIAIGLLLAALGAADVLGPCDDDGLQCALGVFFFWVGVTCLLLGCAHLVASVGVWRGRWWGDWLGASVALVWALLMLLLITDSSR